MIIIVIKNRVTSDDLFNFKYPVILPSKNQPARRAGTMKNPID
jgi:hypothetical protein